MTRQEQIEKWADEYDKLEGDINRRAGFVDGATKADANPNYDPKNPFDKFAKFLNDPEYVEQLEAQLAVAVEALKCSDRHWFDYPAKFACSTCDMGDAGYSSKGAGHHDDECLVLRCHDALSLIESLGVTEPDASNRCPCCQEKSESY